MVKNYISGFSNLVAKFRSALRSGVEQLFNQLMRPKLRNLITDLYKDVSYVLDDDSYSAAEYNDVVRKRFIKAWEGLVDGYKVSFVPFDTHTRYLRIFSAGCVHRVELPIVLWSRARCPPSAMGKVHDGIQVHRARGYSFRSRPAGHHRVSVVSDRIRRREGKVPAATTAVDGIEPG